jgi:hypothetical protein
MYTSEWLITGFKRMRKDDANGYKYWHDVGERILGYIQKVEVKETKTPEEDQLTKELLELISNVNAAVPKKLEKAEVIDISEETIIEMNKQT